MARWIAFSTSIIFMGPIVPEKGPRIKKDLSRVVICSHLAMEIWARPPSPLASIYTEGYGAMEIIVVDNGSDQGIKDMLAEKFPEVRMVRLDKNQGFAGIVCQ